MTGLAEFQHTMDEVYGERDGARGVPATVAWLAEEVGELAKAARKGTVEFRLLEDLGADAAVQVESEAARLDAWLGGVKVIPRFGTPLERELTP